MKIPYFLIALLISSAAIAESSETEKNEANDTLLKCLYGISAKVDDGVTSVETIARVVASNCNKENINFVDVLIRDVYPIDRAWALSTSHKKNIDSAAYFILSNRATRK